MAIDLDLQRLRWIDRWIDPPRRSIEFRRGVDAVATSLLQLGLLKTLLVVGSQKKLDKSTLNPDVSAAAALCVWLAKTHEPEVFATVAAMPIVQDLPQRGPDPQIARPDPAAEIDICMNAVRDLLQVDDGRQWRRIEDESAVFMARLKLLAKALAPPEAEDTNTGGAHGKDR